MKWLRSFLIITLLCSAFVAVPAPPPARADAADLWWNTAWPYRIPVTVSGSGVAQISLNFTTLFSNLGLSGGLLDLRSIRVVPYNGNTPGAPIPYAETYSTMLHNGDTTTGWSANDGTVALDTSRRTQGTASVRTIITNTAGGYGYPGAEYHPSTVTDWRNYELFIYDVWPEVNASALDQAPDLYWYKLYNTTGCPNSSITMGGPALALDRWNYASVSLKPFNTCTTPSFNNITRMEFHTRDDVDGDVSGPNGLWNNGDVLRLWFDNLRLVDQDGGGVIKWTADGSATRYYIYFDTLAHEGHPQPELTTLGAASLTGTAGAAEAGGYYALISGAATGSLNIWAAPPVEKILKTQTVPIMSTALRIQAARDEFEPFQLVVRAPSAQTLAVSISNFTNGSAVIPAADVTLHRVDYVPLSRLSDSWGRITDWPDALYPIAPGGTIAFPAGVNQPLWFTVHVPRTAAAGLYRATVTIGTATVPVELEVWDFALPQQIHLNSEWGFGWSSVVETYKGTVSSNVQPCYWDLVDAFYEDFADHRLTPKGVGWPAGLNYPGGVEYDCNGNLQPDAWGIWGFGSLSQKYLSGGALDNGTGFPSFVMKGPADNWPPDSRPYSFCSQSRGDDPPGNSAYNTKWFQYWTSVSNYLHATSDYASKGYYHIVNEPQTLSDYDIVAYLAKQTKAAAPYVRILVSEQVEPGIYANATYPNAKIDIWLPTITNYEVTKSQDRQRNYNEQVWWYFLYGDRPPLPNPTVIDRTGIEARITPWLAWMERVQGLLYYSITDWNGTPWTTPWSNSSCNGDGYMFYPPKDSTVAFNACNAQSNRLIPSIRWELLREGMEDYEYLWLVNGGQPQIGVTNRADGIAQQFIASRTLFSHVPTDIYATRAALAALLTGPGATKEAIPSAVQPGGSLNYRLVYKAGSLDHTVVITDNVPAGAPVVTATGNRLPAPTVNGQLVQWTVPVSANETLTLTIQVQGVVSGYMNNTAQFSGTHWLTATAGILAANQRFYLPIVYKH